jgi:hypothetical protein
MRALIILFLFGSSAHAQDPVARQMQLDRIEQQQRTIIGTMRDTEMRQEFRESNERLNTMSTQSARDGEAAARQAQERVERDLRR